MTREQQMQDMMTAAFWRDIEEGNQPDNGDAIEIAKTYERAYQQGWRDADQHPQWIPVEERLPPRAEFSFTFSDYVLVCDNIGYMDTACYNFEKNRWDWLNNVTHWMPLPAAPRKEEKE